MPNIGALWAEMRVGGGGGRLICFCAENQKVPSKKEYKRYFQKVPPANNKNHSKKNVGLSHGRNQITSKLK